MGGRGASSSITVGSTKTINNFLNKYKQLDKEILALYDKYDWTTKKGDQKIKDETFNLKKNFFENYQSGEADKNNFFINTMAKFEKTDRPNREPDYISYSNGKISSRYWYTQDGVIRGSNHWGNGVASCDWLLEGSKQNMEGSQVKYGKAKWSDFTQKPEIIKSNGKLIMSNFNNTIGKETIYNSNLGVNQSVAKIKGIDYSKVSKVYY